LLGVTLNDVELLIVGGLQLPQVADAVIEAQVHTCLGVNETSSSRSPHPVVAFRPHRMTRLCRDRAAYRADGFDHRVGSVWVLRMRAEASHALYGSEPHRLIVSVLPVWRAMGVPQDGTIN